jgi:O-antigen/teichoic acid export membrane protein
LTFLTKINSFLNKDGKRSLLARKNILISIPIKGIGMIIMFIMVSLSIKFLGPENYGVWIVLSGIVSWAGMFDFGLSHGLRNHLAMSIAKNEYKEGQSYVSTTYFLLLIIAIIFAVIGTICINFFDLQPILNVYNIPESTLKSLSLIIWLLFLFQFFLKPITSILQANQIPSYARVIGVFGSIVSLGSIYVFWNFYNSLSINTYALFVSGAPVLALLIASIVLFKNKFKKLRPTIAQIKIKNLKKIGGLGLHFFIIQLCLLVVYTSDNYIISYLFGPSEVTTYAIPYKYFSVLTILFTVIMSPYWSAITDAYTKNEFEWIKKTINRLIKILLGGVGIALIMYFFSDFIFNIWVGKEIVVPSSLTALMGIYSVLMGVQTLFSYFSNGLGKIRVQMIVYIFCAVINIPLSYYFGKILSLGSKGVLLATVICLTIISSVLFLQYTKIINNKAKGVWLK